MTGYAVLAVLGEQLGTMLREAKPLIRRGIDVGRARFGWVCSDRSDCYAYGWGETPRDAYRMWSQQYLRCRMSTVPPP